MPTKEVLDQKLFSSNYGVRPGKKPGTLDFSRSKFAADADARKSITEMYGVIKGWGNKTGDTTPAMMDTLKQILDDYYSPNSSAREIVASVKDTLVKSISDKVPEYPKMLKDYETSARIFEESKQLFGIKNATDRKASADSVLKRLQQAMREDQDYRRMFLSKLEAKTGMDIESMIAGQAMSPMLPGGLVGRSMAGGEIYKLAKSGFDPHLLTLLGAASPRVVGEFLNVLGKGSNAVGSIKQAVKQTSIPREVAAISGKAVDTEQKNKQKYRKAKKRDNEE
jgi:predicted DNA-binding protein YlxM (UPF0122 family)